MSENEVAAYRPESGSATTLKKVLRNFSFLSASKIAGDLTTFVLFVVISRAFGEEGLGYYSFAMALTFFLTILADYGLYHYGIRILSRDQAGFAGHFGGILTIRLMLTLAAAVIFAVALPFLPVHGQQRLILIQMAAYHVVYGLISGYASVFVAREEMHVAGIFELAVRAPAVAISIALVAWKDDLVLALWAFPVVAIVVAAGAHWTVVRRCGRPRLRRPDRRLLAILEEATPFCLREFLMQAATRIDVILLGFILGAAAVGSYNAAYRVVYFFYFVAGFIGVSIYPLASRLHVHSAEAMRRLYRQSLGAAVLIGFPAAGGLALIAPDVVRILYSETFADSVLILQVLAALVCLAFLRHMMIMFLMAADRQVQSMRVQAVAAVLAAIGNLVLIPLWGPLGSAIAALVSESAVVVLGSLALRRVVGWPRLGNRIPVAAAGTALFLLIGWRFPPMPIWVVVPMAAAIYAAVLLVSSDIRHNELRRVLQILPGGRSARVG